MKNPSYFEGILTANGWEPVQKMTLTLCLLWWTLELTETRYRSPYTHKTHRLHKALKKERRMQDVTQALFI